jgi:signal transduction histidine kinase
MANAIEPERVVVAPQDVAAGRAGLRRDRRDRTRDREGSIARAPHRRFLWATALAGIAAAGCSVALALTSNHLGEPGLQASLVDWVTLSYIFAGLIAWSRRPASRLGPLMVVAGFTTFASSFQWANLALPYTLGSWLDLVPAALFLHVYLSFPTGRLNRPVERALVAAAYLTALGPQIVGLLLDGFGPDNLLAVTSKPGAAHTLLQVQLLTLSAICLAGVGVLLTRRRGGGRRLPRRSALLVESFGLALVMIAVLFLSGAFEWPEFETTRRITLVTLGLAPVVFVMALLDARLARSSLGDLLVELGAEPAPGDLRDALARALRDPSLTLAYWLPEFEAWVDADGAQVKLPTDDSSRATTPIHRNGDCVAVLVHDSALDDEPELLHAVTAAAEIGLENARLNAELRARLDELRGSRGRVIAAGQKERQRLERNLHDGAQQRLIALALDLRRLEPRFEHDAEAKDGLHQARREIARSLAELRDISRGLHPAVVTAHGLPVALESLAALGPVPTQLAVELDDRLQEGLEVAAYYVVGESLANIGKHAHATSATVAVARRNGELVVEVVDDGIGGADTERGSGLRGLADRIEGLGGRLRVWTPPGGGTRVRAEIPCA